MAEVELYPYPGCPPRTWKRPLYSTALRPKPPEAHYDERAADKVIKAIALLHHFKGEFAGRPFTLLSWQEHEVVRPLFGWKYPERKRDEYGVETDELLPCEAIIREDHSVDPTGPECACPRMYRGLYNETPKKNGKTQIGAGFAEYMAFFDGEQAAEVFCYAADKDQAKLAFDALSFGMFYEGNDFEKNGMRPLAREVKDDKTRSFVRVQSAETKTKHGPNAHCIIFDELHAQSNRDLWDIVTTGVAARRQPLVCAFTTAGFDRLSICWEQHEYARQIAEGIYDDFRFLGVIYSAPEDADWTDPKVWHAANPSLGITVSEDFIAQKCAEAKQMPTAQNAFRQLFLSQWTQQAVRFIPLDKWDACNIPVDMTTKRRALAYGGLDLASTTDLAAFGIVFPSENRDWWDLSVKYYMPADNMRARERRDRVPYSTWVEQGFIKATDGDVIEYAAIKNDVLAAKSEYDLREVSYDPWNAVEIIQALERERVKLVPMRQGYASLSPPTKEMLRLIIEKKIRHGGNPVLRWNVDSAAAMTDANANVRLNKALSTARIDGLVAAIMALDAGLRNPTQRRRSIYERANVLPGMTAEEAKELAGDDGDAEQDA